MIFLPSIDSINSKPITFELPTCPWWSQSQQQMRRSHLLRPKIRPGLMFCKFLKRINCYIPYQSLIVLWLISKNKPNWETKFDRKNVLRWRPTIFEIYYNTKDGILQLNRQHQSDHISATFLSLVGQSLLSRPFFVIWRSQRSRLLEIISSISSSWRIPITHDENLWNLIGEMKSATLADLFHNQFTLFGQSRKTCCITYVWTFITSKLPSRRC